MAHETFKGRLISVRKSKQTPQGKPFSQEDAARLFLVSISTWRNYEHGRTLPDNRSRIRIGEEWPEVFDITININGTPETI